MEMNTEITIKTLSDEAYEYLDQGNYDLAAKTYQNLIANDSTYNSYYWYLGISLLLSGKEEEAQIAWFEAIADIQSDQIENQTNLLVKTLALEAEQQKNKGNLQNVWLLRQYVRENSPENINNLLLLADTCLELNRVDEAQGNLLAILELDPNYAEAYFKLGNIALKFGDLDNAEILYQSSIKANPDSPFPYVNLGAIFLQRGKFDSVEAILNTALTIDSNFPEIYYNLGSICITLTRYDEAVIYFQKAIALKPDYMGAFVGLIAVLGHQNNYELWRDVIEQFDKKFGKAEKIYAECKIIHAYHVSGLFDLAVSKLFELEPTLLQQNEFTMVTIHNLYHHLIFTLPHLRDDLAKNTQLMRKISKFYVDDLSLTSLRVHNKNSLSTQNFTNNKKLSRKLRLGFISPNFKRHSVSWCAGDVICELANITPHIFLYSTRRIIVDERTRMFDRIAEKMYFPTKLAPDGTGDPDSFISQICKDNIDILIDLDSITGAPTNIQMLKAQPAPVCITWMGFDAPFVSETNYYLGDYHTRPEGIEKNYLEKFVRMPDSILAISGFDIESLDRQNIRQSYELKPEQIAYLSVAPSSKLNPETVKAHLEILKQVPNSVLLCKILGDSEVIKNTYEGFCQSIGVDIARIKYVGVQMPEEKHRMIYLAADVLLDSYPMNGGTYTLEALWFNLPVVTKVGEQFCARMGYSFMQVLGIDAGVAWNWEEYIRWGVELGQNPDLRFAVQEQLRKSKLPDSLSPLWNPKKFADDMYKIFEELFLQSQSNQEIYEQSEI
jgi:protein O-GlcNAc transferase